MPIPLCRLKSVTNHTKMDHPASSLDHRISLDADHNGRKVGRYDALNHIPKYGLHFGYQLARLHNLGDIFEH